MKILITGANGTIGKTLSLLLTNSGHEIIHWDRSQLNPINYSRMRDYILSIHPDFIIHLAYFSHLTNIENGAEKINIEWTQLLAQLTSELHIGFLFSSTALVFSSRQQGPFNNASIADALPEDGEYAYHKRLAEEIILKTNPQSIILRLGWQIGNDFTANNMLAHFERQSEFGKVSASQYWKPACSFLNDTVRFMGEILYESPGIYMYDANKNLSFFEIATELNKLHNNRWNIEKTSDYVFDQRMMDDKISVPDISIHFIK